jgi:hypothetical protein
MAPIPKHNVSVELIVDSGTAGGQRWRVVEEVELPAVGDSSAVVEIAIVGRIVQAFARRYATHVDPLLQPLRDVAVGPDGGEPAELRQWRAAAQALLHTYLTDEALDFEGQRIPEEVRQRIEAHRGAFIGRPGPARVEYPPDSAATEVLPRLRVITDAADVGGDIAALRYNTNGGPQVWYVARPDGGWSAVGPDSTDVRQRYPIGDLLRTGSMIVVDPATGVPA